MGKKHHHHRHDVESQPHGGAWRPPPPLPPPPPPPHEEWVAWLMPVFAIANTFFFGYSMYLNDCPSNHTDDPSSCILNSLLGRYSFEPLSDNPLLGPSITILDQLGALDYTKIVVEGERWRLISCIWLHAGLLHLLANLFSLLFVGVRLEQEFGFVKIGTLYMLSGIGGSMMSCLSIKTNISVGASGALFGLLGSMLSELITNWTIYSNKCVALMALILVTVINLAVGILPHVDSSAHIGGFISGFLLGFVLLMRPQFGWFDLKNIPPGYEIQLIHIKPKHKIYQLILWFVALVLIIIGFLGGLAEILHSPKDKPIALI